MSKITKHDQYMGELCLTLANHYQLLYTNIPLLSRRNRLIAEIDIIGIRDEIIDIYEVKCSYRVSKAKKQLKKIKKILLHDNHFVRVRTYFYCGESSKLESIR